MIKRIRKLKEQQAKLTMYFEFLEATLIFLLPFYSIEVQEQIKAKLNQQLNSMKQGVSFDLLDSIDPEKEIDWINRIRRLLL